MNRAGGGEPDGIRDLADRRWISALLDSTGDAVENSLPPFHIVPGQELPPLSIRQGTLAERMF